MSGLTHLRLAALCALAYGLLLVSGILNHFHHTGSLRALVRGLSQPWLWIALLIALLVTFGLWGRYAWAWWLGVIAGAFQLFRLLSPYVMAGRLRVPAPTTLVALVLLLLMIVLLLPRKARLASSR